MIDQFVEEQIKIDHAMRSLNDYCDAIALYENEIREELRSMYSLLAESEELLDSVIEYITANQEQFIVCKQSGFVAIEKGVYALEAINEYHFDSSFIPVNLTGNRIKVINHHCDVLIKNDSVFVYAGYDYIGLDLNKVGKLKIEDLS